MESKVFLNQCEVTYPNNDSFLRCKGKEGLIPSNLVESASADGSTSPLHDAAKRGNIDLLKECLVNRLPVNQMDPAGNTPLHWASRAGQLECVRELLAVPQVRFKEYDSCH